MRKLTARSSPVPGGAIRSGSSRPRKCGSAASSIVSTLPLHAGELVEVVVALGVDVDDP